MKQLMRYKIISGRVVEKRDVLMEVTRTRKPRGGRRGKSTIKQVERNERESVLALARFLNCNYRGQSASPRTSSDVWPGPTGRSTARR